jgi:hypothetical protein
VVLAGVVLVAAAIAVPVGVRGLDHDGAHGSAATSTTPVTGTPHRHGRGTRADAALGSQGDLPPLLASSSVDVRSGLRAGARVRVGNITDGRLRRTSGGWQVVVRWGGRFQPLALRGPVSLRRASWLSAAGLLYTRVPAGTPGRFRVYAWDPQGGSAYTPPALKAIGLGRVCFNPTFTAYGNCQTAG